MKTTYSFWPANGSHYTQDDADKLGPALLMVEKKHGIMDREVVYEESKKKRSPFHRYIWKGTDKEEAKAHRLWRCQNLIASIHIIPETNGSNKPKTVRLYPSKIKTRDGKEGFVNIDKIRDDDFLGRQVLENALSELVSFQRRYGRLLKYLGHTADLDELQGRLALEIEQTKATA